MAVFDNDDPLMIFTLVLIITTITVILKFVYFNLQYFYTIKYTIFSVMDYLAKEGYGNGAAAISNAGSNPDNSCPPCPCSSTVGSTPLSPTFDAIATEIAANFDDHIVDISSYLKNNGDSNKRLDVLNQESNKYIIYNNFLESIKFLGLLSFSICMIGYILAIVYGQWSSPLGTILGN